MRLSLFRIALILPILPHTLSIADRLYPFIFILLLRGFEQRGGQEYSIMTEYMINC